METQVIAIVEFDIEPEDEEGFDARELLYEIVKVKSGKYENMLTGTIKRIVPQDKQ